MEQLKIHYTSNQYSGSLNSGVLTWRHKTGVSSVFESRYFDCDTSKRRLNQGYTHELNYLVEHLQYLIGNRLDYYNYRLCRSTSYVNGSQGRDYSTSIEFIHVFESLNDELDESRTGEKPKLTLIKWFDDSLFITNKTQFRNNKYSMDVNVDNNISVDDFTQWMLKQETLEF